MGFFAAVVVVVVPVEGQSRASALPRLRPRGEEGIVPAARQLLDGHAVDGGEGPPHPGAGAHGRGEPAEGDVARGPEGPVGRGGQPALGEARRVRYVGERGVDLVDVFHQT